MKTLVKHQRQRFRSNCGPTCVAMLAHISQKQACVAMFGKVLSRDCRSFWSDIRRALRELRLRHGQCAHFVTKWESVPDIAIVGCMKAYRT
jgi:hypothetical protein